MLLVKNRAIDFLCHVLKFLVVVLPILTARKTVAIVLNGAHGWTGRVVVRHVGSS